MSNTPKDDDFGFPEGNDNLPAEESIEETIDLSSVDELASAQDVSEPVDAATLEDGEAEDGEAAMVVDDVVTDDELVEEEEEEEEGPREPGLTTAGQYLAASCLAFLAVLGIIAIAYLKLGRLPLEVGCAMIVVPVTLVCLACSIVGLLAKPEKREKLLLIPTLGPILPLATVIVFIIAVLNELKG